MQETRRIFPIESVLPALVVSFQSTNNIVLSAPPGAGKTTQVPIAVLDSAWMKGKKLIMLEPRRLAARRAAEFMSAQLGENIGQTVGYRIRGESKIGRDTRIEVVTEGILTRLLQQNQDIPDAALIIFDEFHERSIHADLGLAFALDVQKNLRSDLRILVMSATLDNAKIARLLENPKIIEGEGRSFPVSTHFAQFHSDKALEIRIAESIIRALNEQEGDILVFLPGRREIRRTENILWEKHLSHEIIVHSLYGDAPYNQQSAALSPAAPGKRKVILSTSIAETSLTIDGVSTVIDSGLARSSRFDVRRGMSGLVTIPVSKAVADQRRGRAGRQQPGICYRLWTEKEHELLPDFPQPEIKTADLASLAIDLAKWGSPNGENLQFIDPPPAPHLIQAQSLLKDLGAVDESGRLTRHGLEMSGLPLHPRLSHMIIQAKKLGFGSLACDVGALLDEGDILAGKKDVDVDLAVRLQILNDKKKSDYEGVVERIIAQSKRLRQLVKSESKSKHEDEKAAGILLALAYPERVARRREKNDYRYLLAGGTTAALPKGSLLSREEFLAIGEVDGIGAEARIFLAAPIKKEDIENIFAEFLKEEEDIRWSTNDDLVLSRSIRRLGAIIISEKHIKPEGEKVIKAMLDGIRQMGLDCLPWDKDSRSLQQRTGWLRRHSAYSDIPDISDSNLLRTLEEWLSPYLEGVWKKEQLTNISLYKILQSHITKSINHQIDILAPSYIKLPSGSHAAIDYVSGDKPVLAVKLQELFGQTETPKILNESVGILLHILSPASRPLAVTEDLKSFWQTTYPKIRTQMRARYPKHLWPEDPLKAKPTNRTVKRK